MIWVCEKLPAGERVILAALVRIHAGMSLPGVTTMAALTGSAARTIL
jgi:hypothetical protein